MLVLLCFYILYKLKSWCPICCKKSYVNLVSCHILFPTIKCSFTNTLITFIYLKMCGTLYWIFHIPLFHYSIIFHIPFLRFHIASHHQVSFTRILLTFITYKLYSTFYSQEHFLYGSSSAGKVV